MEQIREIGFNWTARDKRGYFSTNVKSEIQRMTDYANAMPDEVSILKDPETNGGYLVVSIPKSWFRVKSPQRRVLTDEQKEIISKRMLEIRKRRGLSISSTGEANT